jgi:hypothetical protein
VGGLVPSGQERHIERSVLSRDPALKHHTQGHCTSSW